MLGQLVLARIIEPAGKLDAPRVLEEAGLGRRRVTERPIVRVSSGGR